MLVIRQYTDAARFFFFYNFSLAVEVYLFSGADNCCSFVANQTKNATDHSHEQFIPLVTEQNGSHGLLVANMNKKTLGWLMHSPKSGVPTKI